MNTTSLTKIGVAALALSVAALSGAQTGTNGRQGYSVRVGAFFPNTGSSKINVGVDYKLKSVNVKPQGGGNQPAYLGVVADYYGDSDAYNIPVALTYNVRASRNFLAFAGLGPEYGKESNGDSKISFGAQVGASYEFATEGEGNNPIFVQAKYFFSGKSDLRGFAVSVGYRF